MTSLGFRKVILVIALILITIFVIGGVFGFRIYSRMYAPNIRLDYDQQAFVHIPTGSNYDDVIKILVKQDILIDTSAFKWVASRMGYPYSIKPGRYKVANGMGNKELVSILRAGLQTPLMVTFTGFRTPQQLAQKVSSQIEADSTEIVAAFSNQQLVEQYGFSTSTFIAMFIPNSYEFFWNTDATGFFNRMKREHDAFWKETREEKAASMNLTRIEVSTLASIVEEETINRDERPKVAGVYINRLNRRMPLQADPTVKFALGDFGIRRILTKHLQIDSPYNTYKFRGLPPGPINAPSISSIDAVLNYENHQYIYFCAKSDFSGYHAFAKTLIEHNKNAREYQNALNKQRIYR
jgi:UPF0755 protein